jgi:hypothetical protein
MMAAIRAKPWIAPTRNLLSPSYLPKGTNLSAKLLIVKLVQVLQNSLDAVADLSIYRHETKASSTTKPQIAGFCL